MNWQNVELGDILTLQRGYDLPTQDRIHGDIPIVSSSGISSFHNEAKAEPPGVITGRYGTIGEVFYIAEPYWPLNTTLFVKDFKGNNPKFISYLLECLNLKEMNAAGAVPGVNRNHLHKIKTNVPTSRAYQDKFVSLLDAYDDLIENNLKRIRLLEEMAQITYEEWFVRLKFPGYENTKIDSETGLPEGWVKDRADKMFVLQRGFDLPVQDREKGDIPIIASTGIIDWHSESKVIGAGVITGRSGTIGEVIYCPNDFWPLNTALWVKKYKKGGPLFAYYFLKNFDLNRFGGGSAVPSLDRKVVHAQRVAIPPVDLLDLFEKQIQPVFTTINNLQKQNKLLKEARDILLPRLMTGMIDIDKITIPIELIERVTQTK